MQIRINVISTDKILVEKVKIYFRERKDVQLIYSDHPLPVENTEIFIAPVHCIEELSRYIGEEKRELSIIFYGNPRFLRKAFLAGCEDYLKDPWTIDELALRLTKLIKKIEKRYVFPWGNISIAGTAIISQKGRCTLSFQEYKIVMTLIQHRGKPVPREVLFYSLWNHPGSRDSRIIDVHISCIRKKLQSIISTDFYDDVIISVRGIGYMIK
jgi:DNA-binding winged helix-turn-helix (wHTH) protein